MNPLGVGSLGDHVLSLNAKKASIVDPKRQGRLDFASKKSSFLGRLNELNPKEITISGPMREPKC